MLILVGFAGGWREKAHVGRIRKMVHCIRIVFGLPYNYKPNLSPFEPSLAVRIARCLLHDSFAIPIGSHVAEQDTIHTGHCINDAM